MASTMPLHQLGTPQPRQPPDDVTRGTFSQFHVDAYVHPTCTLTTPSTLTVLVTRAIPWDLHGQISQKKTHSHAQGASGHILRNESPGMYSAPVTVWAPPTGGAQRCFLQWNAIKESGQISSSHLRTRDFGWRLTRAAQSHMT